MKFDPQTQDWGAWSLNDTRTAVVREYRMDSFGQAMQWIEQVADVAHAHDHHPEIVNVYNRVKLTLSTHDAGGLTEKDLKLARALDALEQAIHERRPVHRGGLIHHSDRGSQYVSIRYSERLAEAGIEPSVGSVGDSYDNALAETINGLYKAEVIHRRGPWRSFEAVEFATLEWVDWFNHRRLLEPIGNIPPAEAEELYYAMLDDVSMAA